MDIGKRLRELREGKRLSRGDIQKRGGLLWCYISRVECGHTVPKLETLEKWAKGLGLELYQIFYQGKGTPVAPKVAENTTLHPREEKLLDLFRRMPEGDQSLFLALAREVIKRQGEHE